LRDFLRRIFRVRRRAVLRVPPPLLPVFSAAETAARSYARMHNAALIGERRLIDQR